MKLTKQKKKFSAAETSLDFTKSPKKTTVFKIEFDVLMVKHMLIPSQNI